MCGIAGIIDPRRRLGVERLREVVEAMSACLAHRGPDDRGRWVSADGLCALSHRRLTIIDTSRAGRQPMSDHTGAYLVSFNGEIYNFRELRDELARRGIRFSTRSDTEVLLEAFAEFGAGVYERIEGMYAFAVFDTRHRRLTLARDPFGQKPLYYTTQQGAVAFASELDSLRAVPWFESDIAASAVADYLAFQYIPSPATIFRDTFKVEPGAWIQVDQHGGISCGRHFEFDPNDGGVQNQAGSGIEELDDAITTAVTECLVSDVPLGTLLSSGVDSSLITAVARKVTGAPLKTFSIGFEGASESEHGDAERAAAFLGCDHTSRVLPATVLDSLPVIVSAMDEPNGDPSCLPTHLLSALARRDVKVVLSGDGGDELFGGYETYLSLHRYEHARRSAPPHQRTTGEAYVRMMGAFSIEEVTMMLGGLPTETAARLSSLVSTVDAQERSLIARLRLVDAKTYLPGSVLAKVDRMSMANSLEVRSPLLSRKIARIAARLRPEECLKNGKGKVLLRELVKRYLPGEWVDRPKRGFGLPPVWLARAGLSETLRQYLHSGRPRVCAWIDARCLERFLQRQERPYTRDALKTWRLLILEMWLQAHLSGTPALETAHLRNVHGSATQAALVLHAVWPGATTEGTGFNVQEDGTSGLAVSCSNAGPWTSIYFDRQELPTTYDTVETLTALVSPDLYSTPGTRSIHLLDGDRRSNSIAFEVHPLPDPLAPLVLTSVVPSRAMAGIGFNMQPGGDYALCVEAKNAGPGTQVLFDEKVLATQFGSPSLLSAIVSPADVNEVGVHHIHLRDGRRLSNRIAFAIVAAESDPGT
jgi:asparagine synthase (glutamine-hydrolysing)